MIGVGYEGRTLDDLVAELVDRGVRRLVDVRLTPVSRKAGFSKRGLAAALGEQGIAYEHRPELGNPKDNRAGFGDERTRAVYAARLGRPEAAVAVQELAAAARRETVAVLCFEAEESRCHRQLVLALAGDQEELAGGVNTVTRVGATVRRPTGPWSPRVHELLRHLEARGFRPAPRLLGVTRDGDEVLDFLPGAVTEDRPSDALVVSAAEVLRDYHHATADLAATVATDGWLLPAREPVEVVCHGDFAPYNCVVRDDRVVGVIDFDVAHPGPRLWDVAYAAYRWVLQDADGPDRRLRLFCDTYGLSEGDRAALPGVVVARLHAMVDFMRGQAAAGHAAFAGHIAAGHDALYLRDAERIGRYGKA